MVGGPDIGVEEKLASVGEGPVFGKGEFCFAGFDGVNKFLESTVFADEL